MLEGLGAEQSSDHHDSDDSGDNILGSNPAENSDGESIPSDQIISKQKKQRRARKDR